MGTGLYARLTRCGQARSVIMLHGVGDADLPTSDFDQAMRWLAAEFRGLSLDELLRGLHAEQAYPVLQKLGLPATFFV